MTVAEGLFQFLAQERVGWGTPAPKAIAREMAALDARRALIVASTTLATRTDLIASIEAELGDSAAGLFTGCRAHTPVDTVIDCAAAIRAVRGRYRRHRGRRHADRHGQGRPPVLGGRRA